MTIAETRTGVVLRLHDGLPKLLGDWWWACKAPEKRPDEWCCWDWGCDACMHSFAVAASTQPGRPTFWYNPGASNPDGYCSWAEGFAKALGWRDEMGLPNERFVLRG